MLTQKARFLWRRVMLVLMLPLLFWFPARPAYAASQLVVHYHRDDGDYAKWNIWSWAEGKDGAAYPFNGEDAFGAYAEIALPQDAQKAGFIVRTDAWEKDVSDDRFIDLSQGSEIWVYSATPEFYYEAPEGYAEEAVPISELKLTVHYNRYDGAYENLTAEAVVASSDTELSLPAKSISRDGFGAAVAFTLSDLTSRDKVKIVFTQDDGVTDEYALSLRSISAGAQAFYCVYGSRAQAFETIGSVGKMDVSAVLDAPDTINTALSYPVPVGADAQPLFGFTVTDATTGENVSVQSVEAVNENGTDAVFGRLLAGYATSFKITCAADLPLDHTYRVSGHGGEGTVMLGKVYASERFEELFTYAGGNLGATYTPQATSFRLWAPAASSVELVLLPPELKDTAQPLDGVIVAMEKDVNGTWVCQVTGDLNGREYLYDVTNYGKRAELVDPYAKAVGVNGKTGVVLDLTQTNPSGWENDSRPAQASPTDAIIYELHVRDFSTSPSSGMENKGKYLAFTENGTTTQDGQKTGVDHLKELGINYVHLLPVFDYASLDESKTDAGAFNWGYDPLNYNAPEGSYATDPFTASVRINEFKQMVQALHDNGIGVIMDVVYNHTGPTADSNLNLAVPNYYYRMNANGTFSNGSACGNETASERAMVRKFIVDSVAYWAEEYHIDGFRFDLMGLHDVDTMNAVRGALDEISPSILMYGEGWAGGTSPLPSSKAALKANMVALDTRIAAFSDDIRDGIKGSVFNASDPGYVNGYYGRKEQIKFGVVGSVPHPQVDVTRLTNSKNFWAKSPTQTITYDSAHDNLTLWDKLLAASPNASEEDRLAMNRLSAAIVLTSQGIPFLHAGEDFARTKNGDENSYKSSDLVNQLKWDTKTTYIDLFNYYKGLIELRKAYPAFRMTETKDVQDNLAFLDTEAQVLAYTLKTAGAGVDEGTLLVAFNADKNARTLELPLNGEWDVLVDGTHAGTEKLAGVTGHTLEMTARSAYVLAYKGALAEITYETNASEASSVREIPAATAPADTVSESPQTSGKSRVMLIAALCFNGLVIVAGAGLLVFLIKRRNKK